MKLDNERLKFLEEALPRVVSQRCLKGNIGYACFYGSFGNKCEVSELECLDLRDGVCRYKRHAQRDIRSHYEKIDKWFEDKKSLLQKERYNLNKMSIFRYLARFISRS